MSKLVRILPGVLMVFMVFGVSVVLADEDTPDFQTSVKLGYQLKDHFFGRFQTPEYPLEKAMDSLLLSVTLDKSPEAVVRQYARVKYEKNGKWTRFQLFDGEFHFFDTKPVSAFQLLFVIVDRSNGKTQIRGFTAQGKRLGEELIEAISRRPAPFEPANASWPKPLIVSREEWKARPPKGEYSVHTPEKLVIHHSWSPAQAQYTGSATIRGIQNYHMDSPQTGWMDIGYHFLIGPDGKIFQGRPEIAVGAHAPPNVSMVGICIIGNYDPEKDPLNEKIESSLLNLLSWLSSRYKIDPRLYYFGHRDFSPKSCPGDIVYKRLPFYREQVLKNLGELRTEK